MTYTPNRDKTPEQRKYHLRLDCRAYGWIFHPRSKAKWLVEGPGKNNRHGRRTAAALARPPSTKRHRRPVPVL